MSRRDKEPEAAAMTDNSEMAPPDLAGNPTQAGPATPQADGDDGSASTSSSSAAGGDSTRNLQTELSTLQDRHLRLAAEYDNYRKRSERERSEAWGRAQGDVVKRLLDVLDDLQRVAHYDEATTTVHALHEGVELVEKKLRSVLESAGLETIDAEGKAFDPMVMEAITTVPTGDRAEDDLVADVFQKGYRFQNAMLRPARVRVKKYE